jgi:tricorn protease
MPSYGYVRFPTIHDDQIVFVAEDDLWSISSKGGRAERLTTGVGRAGYPVFSCDGQSLAFVGHEEGPGEIYVMPSLGGPAQRLTYQADPHCRPLCWSLDNTAILYASSAGQFDIDYQVIYTINVAGGLPQQQPYGMANAISFGPDGGVVIGRNTDEPAYWKRYRGGRTGRLWCDVNNSGTFRRLLDLKGNIADPCWVGKRIYFLSDHEGIGNIYSCTPQGEDLQKHSAQQDFYARHLSTDGQRMVFQAGADLYLFDPASGEVRRLDVVLPSQRTQLNRRFVPAISYLDTVALHPQGHSIALTTRGKAFSMSNWKGAVRQHGERDGVRYRFLEWLHDGRRLIAISDAPGREVLTLFDPDTGNDPKILANIEFGRATETALSPTRDQIAIANHRQELILVDLEQEQAVVLDHSDFAEIADLAWAPDGNWLAYSFSIGTQRYAIKLASLEAAQTNVQTSIQTYLVTNPVLKDVSPCFDPDGNYLYFLGYRVFNPVADSLQFEYNFPRGVLPYAIPLRRDMPSPFVSESKLLSESEGQNGSSQQNDAPSPEEPSSNGSGEKPIEIDLEDIADRAVPFPVPEGCYLGIYGIKGKVLLHVAPVQGLLTPEENISRRWVECFDFDTQRTEHLYDNVSFLSLSPDYKTLLYRNRNRLRVVKAGERPSRGDYNDITCNKENGWIDLNRVKVSIQPAAEWQQMFNEAWRLQREQFWTEDMSGIDWDAIYAQYVPLVKRIGSRAELSDLIYELQGELGTSHAYERGGEYRVGPMYRQGLLGVDWSYDEQAQRYRIARIVRGDPFNKDATSPLTAPGIQVQPGDAVIAINGQRVGPACSPQELLVNQASSEVQLTIEPANGAAPYNVTVKTLVEERTARYREWVEQNRRQVHQQSQERVGYIHIPDMAAKGYAEFHRGFLQEYDYPALIVDVRWNGGGSVSSLLLEKLSRRRLGYKFSRWGQPRPYPREAPHGPMVALTNEHAGSDGDIFSHCFKLMKLGTLVGTRTWGGVIGIAPRHRLVDGTITTQPEYANWFVDVGWNIENYGTDPDIEVDIAPQDYVCNTDPQLMRAVAEALRLLDTYPLLEPNPGERPYKGK